jgi:hypothetical protein
VGGVVVWGVGGLPLRSNIPRSALCATLDTYNLFSDSTCSGVSKISYGIFFLRGHLGQLVPQHDVRLLKLPESVNVHRQCFY